MSAHIIAHPDGTWNLTCGSHDVGGGTRTVLALEAAEELGVPPEDVRMTWYSSLTAQESVGTGGSRVTKGSGTAVIMACRDAKWQLFNLAVADGKISGPPDALRTEDGNIINDDAGESVPIKDICARQGRVYFEMPDGTYLGNIIGRGQYTTKRDRWMHFQWNVCVAEVEVDTDTGEVTVERIWVDHDAGRAGFYKGAINQAYGGTIMSMGRALYEGIIKDDSTGISLNPNYLDYKIPTHMDVPEMPINFTEKYDPFGPFGIKGIAEPLCLSPAPAVINAIYNACGVRILSTMATPDKILDGLA
jgi:CO/xanthine dehydrogenase Mo-binding subunit